MASVWPLTEDEHSAAIKQYLRCQKETPCRFFEASVRKWRENGYKAEYLHCPQGNRCHFKHQLPGSTAPFHFKWPFVQAMMDRRQKARREKTLAVSPEVAGSIQPMPDIYNINSDEDSEDGMPMTEEEDQELVTMRQTLSTAELLTWVVDREFEWIRQRAQREQDRWAQANHEEQLLQPYQFW
ncbi:conserved hypothetical protein [Coccidioides posadasii str. Silveira]|uniref:C3H1-type domain-containing protein n=1 Tax=Coccidioides posadasii (strain RMSCC 757 / Silveira) TaxID=443226 RepID=E9DEC1_COCPS|nr:conserved hypothetical protein [Coccidioides posadasii str. Silveira]